MGKLVLFDIDGTLLKGSFAHEQAFRRAFLKVYGIEAGIDMLDHRGKTDLQIVIEVLKLFGLSPGSRQNLYFETLEKEFLIFSQPEKLEVLPGVCALLEKLKSRNIPLGLLTGNARGIAFSKTEKVDLLSFFDVAASAFGDESPVRSDLVEKVRKQGWNPIFLVGDTPRDIEAGKKAKVATIGVATGIHSVLQLTEAGADLVLKDLRDPHFIEFIQ
ncbi:MAG: HAD hydrolase-like protein [bacterium]|nr:HAD hydrolase-like protein [bacterium]